MNDTRQGIITLMKSALLQQPLELPADFAMEAAYDYAKRHHISTMLYDGAVRCGVSRKLPVMQQLFRSYCKATQVSERQGQALNRLFAAFEEAGIDYMPLKGCNMKALYPSPELRLMGDADILIRLEQYDRIVPVMESLGFEAGDISDHEIVWKSDALYLELHKRLIPSQNRDYHGYFRDGWQFAKKREGRRWSMTAEDEWIYLFTHFAKHYRDGGIGCRHVADLWLFREKHPELAEDYIRSVLEQLTLLEFYDNICRLLAVWFSDATGDEKLEFMTEYIFASGSWGDIDSRVLSRTVRDSQKSALGRNGRLVYLWKLAFPSVQVLQGKYTVLKRMPWLLPLVWLIRPFYKFLFERKSLQRQKQEMAALSQENLEERRRVLRYVGLDYRF